MMIVTVLRMTVESAWPFDVWSVCKFRVVCERRLCVRCAFISQYFKVPFVYLSLHACVVVYFLFLPER